MTPFGEGPPPADDFGQPGGRWDEVGLPVTSPNSAVEYSEPAGLILTPPEADPPRVLRVTSATATSGLYPARLEDWDDAAAAPRLADASAAQDCWAQGPNGEALSATRYDGVFLGFHSDGLPVYGVCGVGPAGPAGSNTVTVTEAEEGGAGAITFTGVGEFQTDLGEITDNGGTPRVVRQGFCARNLGLDFNLGDSAFSVPNGAYTAPTAVTFPNFGAGFVIAPQWSSAEFSTASGAPSAAIKLPRSGIYLLCAAVEWAANATGYRYVEIQNVEDGKVYGGLRDLRAAVSGVPMYQTVSGPSPIDGGYTYRLRAAQNSGGSLSILSAFLSAVKIG